MAAVARRQKKTRAEKRAENQARWIAEPDNAHGQLARAKEIIKAKPPKITGIEDLSINTLRGMMRDDDEPIGRRVEAAEVVLGYELPPAALANATVEPISSEAYTFLKYIAHMQEAPSALKFRALKALSAIESTKPRKIDPQAVQDQRRREIRLINAARRAELQSRGLWPSPIRGWFIGPADTVDLLDNPDQTMGAGGRARDQLLAARITSRPDPWDELTASQSTSCV
jgi:hypothetical protein